MAQPLTFQRFYVGLGPGVEHPATPSAVANVLRSMNEAGDLNPFHVRFRMDDGSAVTVKPKRRRVR